MNASVLLTGGCGYIGSSLAPKLAEKGYKVVGADVCIFNNCAIGFKDYWSDFIVEDVTNPSTRYQKYVEESDIVINLAALVGAGICDKQPEMARKVNVDSVQWLVDRLDPEQYLQSPNSNSSYGTTPLGVIAYEDYPMTPLSLYAQTKMDGEAITLTHLNSFVPRLATVCGVSPRMRLDLLVNFMVLECYEKDKIELFAGHTRRNYVHVKDVADMFIYAIEHQLTGVFNFGNDKINCTKESLLSKISEYLDFEIYNSDREDKDKRDYEISSQKMSEAGYTATRDLDYVIPELIEYYSTFPKTKYAREFHIRDMKNA